MRRIKALSLAVAILVFMFAYFFFSSKNKANEEKDKFTGKVVEAVVSKADIGPYTAITSDMLELKKIVVSEGDTDYFEKKEDVLGKITTSWIYRGEKIIPLRAVAQDSEVLGISKKIEKGKRAVGLFVDAQSGVGFNLKAGSYVDVVFGTEVEAKDGGAHDTAGVLFSLAYGNEGPYNSVIMGENFNKNYAMTAIQDIKVLAIAETDESDPTKKGKYEYVTLEVTPRQAEMITLLTSKGATVSLTMRAHDDHEINYNPRLGIFENNNNMANEKNQEATGQEDIGVKQEDNALESTSQTQKDTAADTGTDADISKDTNESGTSIIQKILQ